ncbi:MAG: tetratricopeptide repeat protein [Microcoleus sp. PH2017_40_RAT_O_B]|uniref:tetratricopeptide repeat protein n=1 Tax=unclassified Microcoleus TaxID=2642155 RepID=UPI001D3E093A|nr:MULTISPECIES: tetratricopeptide repeat protein [unclassified Microcoleus]MCC3570952.1 tetratricopeptide repeat protein [Microcoleus sp. PH2017_34_RAT_O_A]MCC3609638.1 tetratricopeptide repeat protein [Microcoleus sp. PH2017_40_RAT_O_B]
MKYQTFLEHISELYNNWGTPQAEPKSSQFQQIINSLQTTTTANAMQLLNFAVECMSPEEIYCEIGCFQGGSLIGTLLNHSQITACAVDDFSEFDTFGDSSDNLGENLANFNISEQVVFCNQNFEEFFWDLREMQSADRIGVLFYDAAHDYRSHLLALLLSKPFLADSALIVVSNSNWETPRQANWDFIAAHPQCQLLFDFSAPEFSDAWNGLQVFSWDVVNTSGNYEWSTFQQLGSQAAIQSIYDLQQSDRKKITAELYSQALNLHQAGKFIAAEEKYKQVLQYDPNQVDAWQNLGTLYYATERYREAQDLLSECLAVDSSVAGAHYSLGLVLEKTGDVIGAVRAYREAIALEPNCIDAYNNLGNILGQIGDVDRAESIYRQAIALNPAHFGSYLNLGNLLLSKTEVDRAIELYETALQLQPDAAEVVANLDFARRLKNDPIQAYLYFGNDCYGRGEYQQAVIEYRKFLEVQTGDLQLYLNLAECYQHLEEYAAAIQVCREAIELYPADASLYRNLVLALVASGRNSEAIAIATDASSLFPEDSFFNPGQYLILPVIYQSVEEIAVYRDRFETGIKLLIQQTSLDTDAGQQKALTIISQHTNFFLAYQGGNDLDIQKQYGQFVRKVMAANYPQWVKDLPLPPPSKTGKIRIGYISGCLWGHTVGKLTLGWLQHSSSEFEVYCYQITETQDNFTQQFRFYSDTFHYIPGNLELICQQIIADQLHVLVFLDIGLQPQMTQLAALRLAPIQCTSWAHPVTSGLPTVDYFLSSDLMEPENAVLHYSEKLIRLPNIGISYPQPTIPSTTATRANFCLREGAVVYLCCQTLCKYLPQHDYIFAEIARQVPQAQFAFISRPNVDIGKLFQQRLQRTFAKYGLDSADFCAILPKMDEKAYWNLQLLSDVFLDSFGWSGGHTTLEAIACNLPIVTCPGEFMRGRHSSGILEMLGVTETVAQTAAEYVKIAVRLGLESEWRQSIADRILQRQGRLYGDKTCVAALEAFYYRAVESV